MDRPTISGECPPGLEYLTQIDQLVVKQQVELLEGKNVIDDIFYISSKTIIISI